MRFLMMFIQASLMNLMILSPRNREQRQLDTERDGTTCSKESSDADKCWYHLEDTAWCGDLQRESHGADDYGTDEHDTQVECNSPLNIQRKSHVFTSIFKILLTWYMHLILPCKSH